MKALLYYGSEDVRVETVDDPKIQNPKDIIIKVTTAAICGSDLHLYGGLIPTVEKGDILGHEFMGEIVETGSEVTSLKKGDRVVIPFPIGCGECVYCKQGLWSLCDTSNRDNEKAKTMFNYPPAAIYGYSHLFGGVPGGQAELVRVPFAEANAFKIPPDISDEQVLFLGDILPTGFMAAENCRIKPDDIVAAWGCGPVGQFAIRSAILLGAKKVVAVDSFPMGIAFNKGLNFKMGQTPVQRYLQILFEHIQQNRINPAEIITHRLTLDQAPEGYKMFRNKEDGCIKVILKP